LKKLGIDAQQRLDQLRLEEHSAAQRKINLLDYYYCSAARQPQELMWTLPVEARSMSGARSDYYKAYWAESRFVFIGEANRALRLNLTCRLPSSSSLTETISIEVNRRRIGEIPIERKWKTWEIMVAGEIVRKGMNEVLIQWPFPEFSAENALGELSEDLINGKFPEFFPVFGEIHSFVASAAQQ